MTRTVLPFLTSFGFQGASNYLEDFVAQIDTPILTNLSVMFLGRVFHIPQLYQLISHAEKFKLSNRASVGPQHFKSLHLFRNVKWFHVGDRVQQLTLAGLVDGGSLPRAIASSLLCGSPRPPWSFYLATGPATLPRLPSWASWGTAYPYLSTPYTYLTTPLPVFSFTVARTSFLPDNVLHLLYFPPFLLPLL